MTPAVADMQDGGYGIERKQEETVADKSGRADMVQWRQRQ